jgi:hypothetical protein
MKKRILLNLPNTLTLGRIFLVPLLVVFLISSSRINSLIAAAIFLAASFTDWLDGNLSEKQVGELKVFLKENPDLEEELSSVEDLIGHDPPGSGPGPVRR